ncbi:MAG: nitrilase-related carbon-nitrogen hydrolase [Candidatus Theseobacter exili]|nr:nitrilase-related carbon-nitrogen hydrolase [Candidatus Theseobacter exili]
MLTKKLLLSLLSGMLLLASFFIPILFWFSFIPLFLAINNSTFFITILSGTICGGIFTLLYSAWLLKHTAKAFWVVWPLATLFFILFVSLSHPILRLLKNKWLQSLVYPAVFVSLYYLYSFLPIGSYWAFTNTDIFTIRSISFFGISGLLFVVIFSQSSMVFAFSDNSKYKKSLLAPAPAIFFVLLFLGVLTAPQIEGDITLGIAQPNLPLSETWRKENIDLIIEKYCELGDKIVKQGAEIIIYPQYSFPCEITDSRVARLLEFARNKKVYIILGTYVDLFNTAVLISPDGNVVDQYSGYGAPPFRAGEQEKASQLNTFKTEYGSMGALLCYDDTSYRVARKLVYELGAELLVAPVNDGYFEGTFQPLLHLSRTIHRAIENRRFLVRAAAKGISCIVDPFGRIIEKLDIGKEGIIVRKVAFIDRLSLFSITGDFVSPISLVLTLFLLLYGLITRKK